MAGWKVDAGGGSASDKEYGVDGLSAMVGVNYWFTHALRGTFSYYLFDGSHKRPGKADEEGMRQSINAVIDYRLSKTLLLYGTSTYSKGDNRLDNSDCTKWVSRVGLMKFF